MSSRLPSSTSGADDTRALIVASIFAKRDQEGTPEETYVGHLKIHEEEPSGTKTRYLILAVTKLGKCVMHKAKRNSNNTFSKGKTWALEDMRVLEQLDPVSFSLTMTTRSYRWSTDRARDLTTFLNQAIKVYQSSTKGNMPKLINFVPDGGTGSASRGGHSHSSSSQVAVGTRLPHRQQAGAGSTASLASSGGGHDLAPPRPIGGGGYERRGSNSSVNSSAQGGRSYGSQEGRHDLAPTSSRGTTGRSPDTRGVDLAALGLGRPGVRRGSTEDSYQSAHTAHTGGRESAASNHRSDRLGPRRPSAASSVIPAIQEPVQEEDDPYGGMADEELLIPPAMSTPVPVTSPPPDPPKLAGETASPVKRSEPRLASPASPKAAMKSSLSKSPTKSPASLAPPLPNDRARTPDPNATGTARDKSRTPEPNQQRRVSFHPPPLTTSYSRDVLLTTRTGLLGADAVLSDQNDEEAGDAIMANVEELIEGFDWTASAAAGDGATRGKGSDAIEGRLLDELAALESANIHAFLESDDRVDQVLQHIDEALMELDDIDVQLTGYRLQLNAVSDDIGYIEGQNRGLQVQTSNQHALLAEIQQLLQITDVPRSDLDKLKQVSPTSAQGVHELEQCAASLYKALQASRDTANEVAATVANSQEYKDAAAQFSTRIVQYLDISFKHQSKSTLDEYVKSSRTGPLKLSPHAALGESLMLYEGLVLFVKDVDEEKYKKLCMDYISSISGLHQEEMKLMLMNLIKTLKSSTDGEAGDPSFAAAQGAVPKTGALAGAVNRTKTAKRPSGAPSKDKIGKADDATKRVSEMYSQGMSEVVNQIVTEDDFINAFLHLADNESTFADYMELDTYFRRQAARHASKGLSPGLQQIARSVMDLMFGFVDLEFKNWIDAAVGMNAAGIVGILAITERLATEAEQEGTSVFLLQFFDKQLKRQRARFDTFISEQVRTIDGAKTTIRKRPRGVFFFIRHFPVFVDRIECQLDNCEDLDIRKSVNDAYERVVASVLGSLQHVAKVVGAEAGSDDDKGQLYFHVVMIENLNVFVDEVQQLNVPALSVFLQRARGLYEENQKSYIKMMLRRGFARLMDFFDGVERLLKTTPPKEVALHSSFNRSALKKVLKDTSAKDMRKAVDAMARRVDKHFAHDDESVGGGPVRAADPATAALIASMWREISAELGREITRATDLIGKSYGDSGLSLDYSARDVEQTCQRAKH